MFVGYWYSYLEELCGILCCGGDAMDIAGELYDKYADEISSEAVSNERYLYLKRKLQNIFDEFEKLDDEIKETVDGNTSWYITTAAASMTV